MKNRINKRIFLIFLLISAIFIPLHSLPLDNIKEYTLENGFTVFILEDTSTPLIRLEYTVRAGFSNQTKETNGFFKLYTNIIASCCKSEGINLDYAQCNADSSRYSLTTVPSMLSETLFSLARCTLSPNYSDEELTKELSLLKQETQENASSSGGFINAAIDSRVFSAFPWKHDSGIYPALFNKTTTTKARNLLQTIGDNWYTPQNSALFISGNINEKTILKLIQESFGKYYSSRPVPSSAKALPVNQKRKFVIHSKDFSADMTQVVIQYTVLNTEEAELTAALLNNDASTFKNNLVNLTKLAIPGNEYINAAAAHKKDSSRLIIQTLLQKPENKEDTKITSDQQAELFIKTAKEAIQNSYPEEFYFAKQNSIYNLSLINSSSSDFMDNLAAYWAMAPYNSFTEQALDSTDKSLTAANYFAREENISQIDRDILLAKLNNEEPFIFIIINDADFKKNKKAYTAAGYEEINSSNAAWYNQAVFADYKDAEQEDLIARKNEEALLKNELEQYTKNYYETNLSLIKKSALKNGIEIITKPNNNSSDITILLSIEGGKLKAADDNGFEEVLISLLAGNLQKEILAKQQKGIILGNPVVDYNCSLMTGTVSVECSPYDFEAVCRAISDAIIYGEILPAQADRAIANRQYKKRLENGTVSFQMIAAIMKDLYPKTDYPKIFEAKKDILTKTSYQKILENYPQLLDASRYSIILTGFLPEQNQIQSILESTMGLLTPLSERGSQIPLSMAQSKLKAGSTKKTIKVTHTFLTDIPAEKAGPMPSKLIPTTEFLDPVIYVFKIAEPGTKENILTQAVLKYLEVLVQNQLNNNTILKDAKPYCSQYNSGTDTIYFIIQSVSNQKEADSCFAKAVQQLKNLFDSDKQAQTIRQIKDYWIKEEFEQSLTNTGTAYLLQKGFEYLPYSPKAEFYLTEYSLIENADRTDFIEIIKDIPEQAPVRYYAKN